MNIRFIVQKMKREQEKERVRDGKREKRNRKIILINVKRENMMSIDFLGI